MWVVEGLLATPEQLARHSIDRMLELSGWSVQDAKSVNFTASWGIKPLGCTAQIS
jgi:hypothetical protein